MAAMDAPMPSRSRLAIRLSLLLIPAVAFLLLLTIPSLRRGVPQPGDAAPAFSAPLLTGGGTLALEDLEGKPVVLNFWASWCAPCEDEAPLLKDAHRAYGDDISFVGVNIKDARSDALAFDEEWDLDYPDVRDEGSEIFRAYGLTGQPETFFIDSEGTIVEHVNGPIPDAATLSQLLETLVSRG